EVEQDGYTVRRKIGGVQHRTFAVSLAYIHAETSGTSGTSGIEDENPRGDAEFPVPDVAFVSGTMPDDYPASNDYPARTRAGLIRGTRDVPDVPDVCEGIPPAQERVTCALDTLRAWHEGGALTALPDPVPGMPAALAGCADPALLRDLVPQILDSGAY